MIDLEAVSSGLTVRAARAARGITAPWVPDIAAPADLLAWYRRAEVCASHCAAHIAFDHPHAAITIDAAANVAVGRYGLGPQRESPELEAAAFRVAIFIRQCVDQHLRDFHFYNAALRKLVDGRLDDGQPPEQIEAAMAAFNARYHGENIWPLVCRVNFEIFIRDRVRAWRWRNSARGRRAMGR